MHRSVLAAGLAGVVLATTALPAMAASGSASTSYANVTYDLSAIQMDGSDCVDIPVTYRYSKTTDRAIDVNLILKYAGSSSETASDYEGLLVEAGSGTQAGSVQICPSSLEDGRGPLNVTGGIEPTVTDWSTETASFAPTTVDVVLNPTVLSGTKTKAVNSGLGTYWRISGKATARTVTKGVIGAQGTATLFIKKSGRWMKTASTTPNDFGEWSFDDWSVSTQKYARGSAFRVDLTECRWCTNASMQGKLR